MEGIKRIKELLECQRERFENMAGESAKGSLAIENYAATNLKMEAILSDHDSSVKALVDAAKAYLSFIETMDFDPASGNSYGGVDEGVTLYAKRTDALRTALEPFKEGS